MPNGTTRYTVDVLRSGQPRAYADTENEYLITVEATRWNEEGFHPWVHGGDIETQIKREETERAAGRMFGGHQPDEMRAIQRNWAVGLVRVLCQNFREPNDKDGRTGMDAHFFPTLKKLIIDHKAGTVRALIIEPFTD